MIVQIPLDAISNYRALQIELDIVGNLLVALIPPTLALAKNVAASGEFKYIDKKATVVSQEEGLMNVTIKKADGSVEEKKLNGDRVLKSFSKAVVILSAHIEGAVNFLVGAALAVYVWPAEARYAGAVLIVLAYVVIYRQNMWTVLGTEPLALAETKRDGGEITIGEWLLRQERIMHAIVIFVLLAGSAWSASTII